MPKQTDEEQLKQLHNRFGNYLERGDVEIRVTRRIDAHRRALGNPYARLIPPRATWRTNATAKHQQESDGALQEGNN